MAFLRNDAVNRVNLHYGIQAIAQAGGLVFFVAVLLRAGVSVPGALLNVAAVLAGRIALRPAMLPMAKRWGLKPLLIAGTLIMAIQYPLLAMVHGVGPALVALCVASAAGDIFYWPTYHAYFAAIGDTEHRGHQVSAREAVASIVGIGAPLAGAWALITFGPVWMFCGVALIQALSAIPLLSAPNVSIARDAPGAREAARLGFILFATDGWIGATYGFAWQIALFLSLGSSLSAYGGAMALAALVGAVFGLVLGKNIDAGHGRRAVLIAYGAATVVMLLRAASFGSPWLAVAANALGAVVGSLQAPVMNTATYNLSKASPCPMRFAIAGEAGWDTGCFLGCLMAAGLSALGVSRSVAVLMAFPVFVAAAWLLRRYYATHALDPSDPAAVPVPPLPGETRSPIV
jgi:DHA1 family inner membrane transport protein